MKTKHYLYLVYLLLALSACEKADYLDDKQNTEILTPTTLPDFQQILDNTGTMATSGGLAQISSDDNDISYANYLTATATERNAYVWARNIYDGDVKIQDWDALYKQVFYSNIVLEGLAKSDSLNSTKGQYLRGWALFCRAFAFYDLTQNFCNVYDGSTASLDLGIPLRLSSAIDYTLQRSTLHQAYDRILSDLNESLPLLPFDRAAANLNRPSKNSAYALLSRIYLNMRDYSQAEKYADASLAIYSALIDYNTISKTSETPFSRTNLELINYRQQVAAYSRLTDTYVDSYVKVNKDLLALYAPNDLRKQVYFDTLGDGTYTKKKGYHGYGGYPFTGLATDELYLIKAECLARRSEVNSAMDKLNELLKMRFLNTTPYIPLVAISATDALEKVLLERRKELVWRGIRWHDIKRLNKEGANITLTRTLNNVTYTLPPNDIRYIFPIPDDEISFTDLKQNPR